MKNASCAVPQAAVIALLLAVIRPALALDPALPPSSNFDLTHWKLTLPTGHPGKPDEILPTDLIRGHQSEPYFFTSSSDGALRFWAPVTGVTTGGSSYPRSELREQLSPGKNTPNWYADGTHVLDAECRIVKVPSSGRVIIGQVHGKATADGANANPLIKLAYDYESRSLRVQVKHSPHREETSESNDIVPGIDLGSLIKYQIKIVDGVAHVTVNGTTYVRDFYATSSDWADTDLYFKAGAYCIDNSGPSSEGAVVDFYAVKVSHQSKTESTSELSTGAVPALPAGLDSAPPGQDRAFVMEDNQVVMESKRSCSQATRSPLRCETDYAFIVPTDSAGAFYAHVHTRNAARSHDSLFLTLNGDNSRSVELVTTGARDWRTSRSSFALPAGPQVLTLRAREDGIPIDKLVINTSRKPPKARVLDENRSRTSRR